MSSPSLTTQILSVYIYLFIYTLATPINTALSLSLSLFLSAWITSLRLITGKRGKLRAQRHDRLKRGTCEKESRNLEISLEM